MIPAGMSECPCRSYQTDLPSLIWTRLEDENRRLRHLVADLSLDKEVLKAVIARNGSSP